MAATAFVTGGSGFIGAHLIRRLIADGWTVRALARSARAADRVEALGAVAIPGDLAATDAIAAAADGAGVAFHAAAAVLEWGPRSAYVEANVHGTANVLDGCRRAGVQRFVHVGTEAALMAGQPLIRVDEKAPLRPDSPAHYPATKAEAEQLVRDGAGPAFATVVVRPRLVWGPGDTTILPGLAAAVREGRFAWIGGGRHLTDTTHVANVVEGLVLGAERGRSGEAYFVTDGEPIVFREFVTRLLAAEDLTPPSRELPVALARAGAVASEAVWRLLRRDTPPPLSRMPLWLASQECTIDISKARAELGYEPVVSRDEGLRELAAGRAA